MLITLNFRENVTFSCHNIPEYKRFLTFPHFWKRKLQQLAEILRRKNCQLLCFRRRNYMHHDVQSIKHQAASQTNMISFLSSNNNDETKLICMSQMHCLTTKAFEFKLFSQFVENC